jgi:hypothetical protein
MVFVDYLKEKGRITGSQLLQAKARLNAANLKTGLCAYAFGFIDRTHIDKIMGMQQRTGLKFGDIAVALGCLTQGQVHTILRLKEKYRVTLEEALVMDGFLTSQELEEELRLFHSAGKSRG